MKANNLLGSFLFVLIVVFLTIITSLINDKKNWAEERQELNTEVEALKEEIKFLKELILKGANRDSLYREHMGKTLYLDNNSVEVGYDNYLRMKDY